DMYDVVFCDPPYADMELLALLLAGPELRRVTRGVLVLRALRKHAPAVPEQWVVERDRDVGEHVVRYLRGVVGVHRRTLNVRMDIQFLLERLEALVVNGRNVPMTSQIVRDQGTALD